MSFTVTNDQLYAYFKALGCPWPIADGLKLVGVTGAVPYGENGSQVLSLRENKLDEYNDAVGCMGPVLCFFQGSTDPGKFYTDHPTNAKGAAHLLGIEEHPQPWLFTLGLHKGHPALKQASAVTVRRDSDRDGDAESGEPLDSGFFGIDLHAGGASDKVGPNSAGCQIVKGGWKGAAWLRFYEICKHWEHQKKFPYYRINGERFARFIGALPPNGGPVWDFLPAR